MNPCLLREKLKRFFEEDIGTGDVTSNPLFTQDVRVAGQISAKENGIFCGQRIVQEGLKLLDHDVNIASYVKDGESVKKGQTLFDVSGNAKALLMGERVILNLIQRMSGIATMTAKANETLNDPSIRICDTRKTMPGLRMFDKFAVKCGGGYNHRFGLYDAVMLKENHIAAAGGILKAVEQVRKTTSHMVNIEVETENNEEVLEAVEAEADVIMFDNFSPEAIKQAVPLVPDSITTEASGGIKVSNLSMYKGTGVNYISLGCLTHSVKALDISFIIQ